MNYRSQSWITFKDYIHKLVKFCSVRPILNEEIVTRFLTSPTYFNRVTSLVKPQAFLPKNNRTSVFRIVGLSTLKIWEIGEGIAHRSMSKQLYGRGDILVGFVKSQGLDIHPDNNPPGHADIINWPDDRAKQLQIAVDMAANAVLILKT